LNEPKKGKHRGDCQDENGSENRELSKDRQSPPATGTRAASFGLVGGRTPVATVHHGNPWSASTRNEELGLAKA
jgi:hypothetical protein